MRHLVILAVLAAAPIGTSTASARAALAPLSRGAAPQRVEIRTDDDLTIVGDYYAPTKKETAPAALLVHDAGRDRTELSKIAEKLQRSGFGVLNIDLRGHGESKTADTDWDKLDEDGRRALWAFAPRDLEAAADWLRKQEGIHRTNLSVVGNGAGCALAVRHASRDENVRCVALIGPDVKNYGFDVAADIHEIEGLPTFVFATRQDAATERMVQEANSTNGGYNYIDLEFAANTAGSALEDRRVSARIASWMKDCAVPRKGKS